MIITVKFQSLVLIGLDPVFTHVLKYQRTVSNISFFFSLSKDKPAKIITDNVDTNKVCRWYRWKKLDSKDEGAR